MMNKILNKKPPTAWTELRALSNNKTSIKLNSYYDTLKKPKKLTMENLIEGVEQFIKIANLNSTERIDFFGNQFLGVHYNNDITQLWNNYSSDKIKAHQLDCLRPSGWDYVIADSLLTLIYKGDKPSTALKKLLQGPTVIDCGMFSQLSLWFGILHVLGDESFDKLFGKQSFYLTQIVYNKIEDSTKAHRGNPLYTFLSKESTLDLNDENTLDLAIEHIRNHTMYQSKHPGGNYGGENCIVIKNKYTIFDPTLESKSNLTKKDVQKLLIDVFNAKQNKCDEDKISLWKEQKSEDIHPVFFANYSTLIQLAEELNEFTVDEEEWASSVDQKQEGRQFFNFKKFVDWVQEMTNTDFKKCDYQPLENEKITIPKELMEQIPFENRKSMSFNQFKQENSLQKELYQISLKFCQDVMNKTSAKVILTGNAGIGKTASAVSCAKELASKEKKIVWFSEVMIQGWTGKTTTMEELGKIVDTIRKILTDDVDAVFLDDDNLSGFCGEVLLEEVMSWYSKQPARGIFITSNQPLTLNNCYGWKLDNTYHRPPFINYNSKGYKNTSTLTALQGVSQRKISKEEIEKLSEDEKTTYLIHCTSEQSVGILISAKNYQSRKKEFGSVEFIPGFKGNDNLLPPIRRSLKKNGVLGSAYDKLSSIQKKWLKTFTTGGHYLYYRNGEQFLEPRYQGIAVIPFEKTKKKTIVLEIQDYVLDCAGRCIDMDCMNQLLRIINYAHDAGGKKVILINDTAFSNEELLKKIKEQIPKSEQERTIARLENLLYSPSLVSDTSDTALEEDSEEEIIDENLEKQNIGTDIKIAKEINFQDMEMLLLYPIFQSTGDSYLSKESSNTFFTQEKNNKQSFITPSDIEIAFSLDKGTILKYGKSKITCSENFKIENIDRKINNCLEKNNKQAGIMVGKSHHLENTIFITFGDSKFDSFVKEQCDKVNFKESDDSYTDNKIEIKSSNSGFFKVDQKKKEEERDKIFFNNLDVD